MSTTQGEANTGKYKERTVLLEGFAEEVDKEKQESSERQTCQEGEKLQLSEGELAKR